MAARFGQRDGWHPVQDTPRAAEADGYVAEGPDGAPAVVRPDGNGSVPDTHANTLMLTPKRSMLEKAGKPGDIPDSIPWELAREMGGN